MNVINRVALRTMKLNRVRTIVTVIGIILSAAMFTAVFTICTSLYNFIREAEVYSSGSYHLHAMQVPGSDVDKVSGDSRTEYAALVKNLGYAVFDSVNPDKPYICVLAADGTFTQNMPVHLTSGRMPQNENELLLPDHAATNGGASYAVGDTLALALGTRTANDGEEALHLYQQTRYTYEAETLTDTGEKTYTVVGTYERPDFEPYFAPGYSALTVLEGDIEADSVYDIYVRVNSPRKNYFSFVKEHAELTQNGAEEHDGLLGLEGASRYDNLSRVLVSFAVILSLLVFAGSVALIYSAFSISVSERTKQFGLLSSVGATQKQVRRSVLTEALTLSAIGIPIGVLAGIGGIALTLYLLRDKFASFLSASESITIHVHVTWPIIAAAVAVALLTVLVSAWIPAVRAMRISPIEAIRQTRDVKAKAGKSTCYPKLFVKLFGTEGMLAKKYFVRSSKKYRATIISLAMSVILFVAASAFCLYITRSATSVDNRPNFDASYSGLPAEVFTGLRSALAEHATEFAGYKASSSEDFLYASIPDADSTHEYKNYFNDCHADNDSVSYSLYAQKIYMDDVSFSELLKKNGLSEEGWFDPEHPRAIMVNSASVPVYKRLDNGNYTRVNYVFDFVNSGVDSLSVAAEPERPEGYVSSGAYWSGSEQGDGLPAVYYVPAAENSAVEYDDHGRPVGQIEIPLEFYDIEIGALIEEAPVGGWEQSYIKLIYPASIYNGDVEAVNFFFRSENTARSIEEMTEVMQSAGVAVGQDQFYDAQVDGRLMNNIVTIVKVFSYGFITLISLIAVANVFNTVSTNVALRRRDYAMLRSMGMTQKGISRMSNYECLIYGSRSLLIGLPIAIGVTYLIHLAANDAAHMRFTLPWTAIGIAVVSVFLVVFLSMLYSTSKLKKDNPIDALKDENI